MNNRLGLLFDERYLRHKTVKRSLENPERIRSLNETVQHRYDGRFAVFTPREASREEVEAVHSRFYLDQIREHAANPDPYSYDPDTYLMEESLYIAGLAAGGCLTLADEILSGNIDCGYALVRPPGHHAEAGRGMGFCVMNNVGITANYLRSKYQLHRILVLDFDVHHGNGTQDIFYETDEVLFVSLHQRDLFPSTGKTRETGRDAGSGYTFNIEVHPQFGDSEYIYLVGRLLQGIVEQYMPQIILVSAGYDGHRDDPISATSLTTGWYGTVATMLQQYAAEVCDGRLLFVLEGGYNPEALQDGVLATLDSLLAPRISRVGVPYSERADVVLRDHPLKNRWNIL
ncbi:histone deacetylase family protein [Desulfopila aestuarii]|uniref:Acetoin utilization deacetylase AcuC n=1 Tax=Desulfopila aestuarii DSM 18488 TaxID=1121416 RepID=A0A1M7Y5X5_9BACT|nr:histone deacetylase [Desulfopila aestuarii]SHO47959.1 Acetoin utilization deacetylase AcuC [Desulfopila aestuarii DSM 18488]